MKHLLSIAYAFENANCDQVVRFLGEEVRLTQFSTNFNFKLTKKIIEKYDGSCDAICFSGHVPRIRFGNKEFVHPQSLLFDAMAKEVPIAYGQKLKEIYIPWAIRKLHKENPQLFANKRIAFYTGVFHFPLLEVMEEFGNEIIMADPYYFLHLPFNIRSRKALGTFIKFLSPFLKKLPVRRTFLNTFELEKNRKGHLKHFFSADIFVVNASTLSYLDLKHLKNKTLIIDFLDPELEKKLREVGVGEVIVCLPPVIDHPYMNFSIFEGLLQAFQPEGKVLDTDDLLDWIDRLKLSPRVTHLAKFADGTPAKFAFIVHPLRAGQLFMHPKARWLKRYSRPLEKLVENISSRFKGGYYGHMKGIVSEKTGKEVRGDIYFIPDTPRKLLAAEPEKIYEKLLRLCREARNHGASIVGLGAYTKVVGDAGVSLAKKSPLPITTGNSLSSAATLWAAKLAILKMNFVEQKEGVYQGTAMVVGATGSIGAVSAKILAQNWKKIILVAPRAYRLLELKEEIEKLAPSCEVLIATDPDESLGQSDLIITSTSNQGNKIFDIMRVKPGAVICDVSRPFDITEDEAIKRPDVMVIASGEVYLPGKLESTVHLGLEGKMVYACLAEAALLAMEGRFECFTLSKNIQYERVLEIDRMAQAHGVRLAGIMGHNGAISDHEFELCRKHALAALKKKSEEKEEHELL